MTHVSVARPGGLAVGRHSVGLLPAWAAALSLSAAFAHLGVAAEHWSEWWAYGAFFYACTLGQVLLAVLVLWRPWQWVAFTGIAGTLAILGMYVYSRTNGPPMGPHGGVPEAIGVYDFATAVAELALVVVLLLMLGERAGRWAVRLVALTGGLLWAAKLTGIVL